MMNFYFFFIYNFRPIIYIFIDPGSPGDVEPDQIGCQAQEKCNKNIGNDNHFRISPLPLFLFRLHILIFFRIQTDFPDPDRPWSFAFSVRMNRIRRPGTVRMIRTVRIFLPHLYLPHRASSYKVPGQSKK